MINKNLLNRKEVERREEYSTYVFIRRKGGKEVKNEKLGYTPQRSIILYDMFFLNFTI